MANIIIGTIGLLIGSGGVWYYFFKRPRLKINVNRFYAIKDRKNRSSNRYHYRLD